MSADVIACATHKLESHGYALQPFREFAGRASPALIDRARRYIRPELEFLVLWDTASDAEGFMLTGNDALILLKEADSFLEIDLFHEPEGAIQ